ncbi:MAG: Fe3+-hydroxamate ABC transporter ATP-binding protein FhuC [Calditrichia bacterium]
MIDVHELNFAYNGTPILKELSFSVKKGEFVGIIGPNGAGKSTLLKLLDGILFPQSGSITIDDKPLGQFNRRALAQMIGFVPQEFTTAFNFTALEIVLMGRFPYQRAFGFESAQDREIACQAMQTTDCWYLRDRGILTLSGGERQRVVLASALAQSPKILLLDEPTTALDLKHQVHFYRILTKLRQENNLTILTVTHDINLTAQFCQRILILKEGQLVADGAVDQVIQKEILESVYETPMHIFPHPVSKLPVVLPV